jgi:hypothetical protein
MVCGPKEAGDREGNQRLIQDFLPCPFSQARMIELTKEGKVLSKRGDPPSPCEPSATARQAIGSGG